jgi:large subunit ribosomal protein L25
MSDYTIEAQPREEIGKRVKHLRQAGQVPCIIYGPKTDPVPVALDTRALADILAEAGGTSVVDVKVGKDTHQVLVRDVQRDILRGDLMHVDFYAVDMEQVTRVEVPVVLLGESPIVASRAAISMQGVTSILVEGLPMDLINEVTVDMEELTEIGMGVTVGDLYVPSKLTVITDSSELVVKIDYMAIEEEEEEELDEELMFAESAEPEVIGRGAGEEEVEEDEE